MMRFLVAAVVAVGSVVVAAPADVPLFAGTTVMAKAQDPAPAPSERPAEPSAPSQPSAQPAPSQPAPQVNVEIRERGWYASPTWIAIGAIGLAVLILVVVMASRTGSNTVIRG